MPDHMWCNCSSMSHESGCTQYELSGEAFADSMGYQPMQVKTLEIPVQIKLTKIDLGETDPDRFVDDLTRLAARESAAVNVEPKPIPNQLPHIADLVIADINARKEFGLKKYGTALQPHNGRDALTDAYQEAVDLCKYLRQAIYERDGK